LFSNFSLKDCMSFVISNISSLNIICGLQR
jgi:hypothetical protein